MYRIPCFTLSSFFFNHPAPPEIYTLSLHDALPISRKHFRRRENSGPRPPWLRNCRRGQERFRLCRRARSEEHTSELQSRENLVCRLLLEKKKKSNRNNNKSHDTDNVRQTVALEKRP